MAVVKPAAGHIEIPTEELIEEIICRGYATPLKRELWSQFYGELVTLQHEVARLRTETPERIREQQLYTIIGELAGIQQGIEQMVDRQKDIKVIGREILVFREEVSSMKDQVEKLRNSND